MTRSDQRDDARPSQLREYLAIFRLRKWWVIGVVVIAVGSAVIFSVRQMPVYVSRAKVLVEAVDLSGGQAGAPLPPNIETEKQLVDSIVVAKAVAKQLDLTTPPEDLLKDLSIDAPTGTEILAISYKDPAPREAQRRAQAFAERYLDLRRGRFIAALRAVANPLKQRVESLNDQLKTVNAKLARTNSSSQRRDLQYQASSLVSQIAILRQRLADQPTEDSLEVGQIEDPADLPEAPANRGVVVNAGLALFLGLAAGVGVALVRDRLDDRLRASADFEATTGVPLLAMIPRSKDLRASKPQRRLRWGARKVTAGSPLALMPTSPVADAFRMLRAGLLFTTSTRGVRTLLITSPGPGDGKTTVVAYLGWALAHAGKRVVLVSADLRRPRLSTLCGVSTDVLGLCEVLAGTVRARDATVRTETPNLALVPPGIAQSSEFELLGSDVMGRFLHDLAQAHDIVLVDAPPVLDVPDALAIAGCVDGVILVANASGTRKDDLASARRQLHLVDAQVLGGVLTNFNPAEFRYYGHRPGADYRYEYPGPKGAAASSAGFPQALDRDA